MPEPVPAPGDRSASIPTAWQDLKSTLRQAPSGTEAFVFEVVSFFGRQLIGLPRVGGVLRGLGRAFGAVLEAVSPAMPINISQNASFSEDPRGFYGEIFKYTFPIACFFCLIMNGVMAGLSGTLWGAGDGRLYYLQDWYNLVLYLLVCPAYVSSAVCLVATTAISWGKFNNYSNKAEGPGRGHRIANATRFSAFLAVAVFVSGVYTAQYIGDLANPALTADLYWFFDQAGSGERILNKAGAYYLFMTAILLLITAMAAFCYIAMSIEMFRLGRSIESSLFAVTETELTQHGEAAIRERERRLKEELADFSWSYIWAKVLVLIYGINIWIWQISPAGRVSNVHSAIVALVIVGLFFLVVPQLYLASKWYRLKRAYKERWTQLVREATRRDDEEGPEYPELRPRSIRKIDAFVNLGMITFLGVIVSYQYGFGGVSDLLVEITKWLGSR